MLSDETRRVLDQGARMLIGGEWVTVGARRSIPVLDPSSGQEISALVAGTAADVDAAVGAAKAAFDGIWASKGPGEREALIRKWADLVEGNAMLLAQLETVDVGMPLWMATNLNVQGTLGSIRYMSGWPTKISGRTVDIGLPIPDAEFFGYTVREPIGVIGAIIPWNVPLMLAAWKIAPALAAGCTIVVKPSENACLSVLVLADLGRQAGIPDGVINVVTGYGQEAGEALVRHPDVSKITFTGSTGTGIRIAKAAAEGVKKITLELGGKSPQVLFDDANLDQAIPGVANGIFLNSGQICVAGSRLYVQRSIFEQTVERLAQLADKLRVGPGLLETTQIGPVVSAAQRDKVAGYIASAEAEGASIASGSGNLNAEGFYVRPTVITDAKQSMKVAREEIFGPVLTVIGFDEFDEGVSLANDSVYGLAACVWTQDLSKAMRFVKRIKTGKVAVNSDPIPYPALPEGGRKASGYGRDLGEEAIDGFLETKSVLIRS
ncbi:aldehyde dehydrogenase family protein [Mesorhizobium sp. M1329]|uniref:aldehyde dehydrogenase family protein n=1 Tax=Mesorhizobium sp. M1329 TaxID=2957083 RepID=UPI00333D1837